MRLDGRRSRDSDGESLTYQWILLTRPEGSAAALSDPTAVDPTFVADRPGYYVAQLVVSDTTQQSLLDIVVLSTINSRPVANAGLPQTVAAGDTVALDGRLSEDADGEALQYRWALLVVPEGSTAMLAPADAVQPTFVADVAGPYVA